MSLPTNQKTMNAYTYRFYLEDIISRHETIHHLPMTDYYTNQDIKDCSVEESDSTREAFYHMQSMLEYLEVKTDDTFKKWYGTNDGKFFLSQF
jgi:hypothetical protein